MASSYLASGGRNRPPSSLSIRQVFMCATARSTAARTQLDLDSWFAAGPSTRQHALTFLSWGRQQRILRGIMSN